VRDFYTDTETTLVDGVSVLQTVINGIPVQVTTELISSVIGVPVESDPPRVPYPKSVEAPSMDDIVEFFDPQQAQADTIQQIKIGTFASPYQVLAKIVLHNLWP
jgi:hypothetical protein